MKRPIKAGTTDKTLLVYIPDPASTDGSGKTGLAAADLTVSYTRTETDNDVVVTDATSSLNNIALTDAHTDWGVEEVSSTLAPGLYRLDVADAVFATGATEVVVYVMITSSAAAASPMEFYFEDDQTFGEPGQGAPAAALSRGQKIDYLYKAWRNRVTQTSTTYSLYADDATTVDQKATVADDGTTFSRTEIAAGP